MESIFEAIRKSVIRIEKEIKSSDGSFSKNLNSTGDTQLKLDVISDEIIEQELKKVDTIKVIISEEKENSILINQNAKYLVGYDPLDGSSLVDVNQSVGSIFGIYENTFAGNNLVASVYAIYGARVDLVIAQNEVKLYRLNKDGDFEFIKVLSLAEKGHINATGGTQKEWFAYHREFVNSFFKKGYRLEYSGGMVPDLHSILLQRGGLFSYPATMDKEKGKLRMIFEVFPFAYIFEKAGGKAIDGKNRVLDFTPEHLHDTMPCFFGSTYEIEEVREAYANRS